MKGLRPSVTPHGFLKAECSETRKRRNNACAVNQVNDFSTLRAVDFVHLHVSAFINSFGCSFVHSFISSSINAFIQSFLQHTHPLIHPSMIHPIIRSSIHPSNHPFIQPSIQTIHPIVSFSIYPIYWNCSFTTGMATTALKLAKIVLSLIVK